MHLGKARRCRRRPPRRSSPGRLGRLGRAFAASPCNPQMREQSRWTRPAQPPTAAAARLRQLVLHRDAHPAARAARGDVRDLFVLPRGRRHRRRFERPARRAARDSSRDWRDDIDALYAGKSAPQLAGPRRSRCANSVCKREDFLAVIDGMEMDVRRGHPRAGLRDARSLLRPGRERGRAAVGAGVRHGGGGRHCARASSRPRAAAHQHPARPRRGRRRSAGSICRARRCARPASRRPIPRTVLAQPGARRRSARASSSARARISPRPTRSWRAARAARARAAHHGRGLSPHPRRHDRARLVAAARPRPACRASRLLWIILRYAFI